MIKNKEKRERRKKTVPIWIGILVFIGAFIIGIVNKTVNTAFLDGRLFYEVE